jgi:GTP pyrophosphokinase
MKQDRIVPVEYEYLFGKLITVVADHFHEEEIQLIDKAYNLARKSHAGQMRDEGTPYITHPVRVALILVEELEYYSQEMICSALLHDVIEDSEVTHEEIAEVFGERVAVMVTLLTKVKGVGLPLYLSAIESASDRGALIVKLCDRLDNLRSIKHSSKAEKKRRYIRTTKQYYLPLASATNEYLYQALISALGDAKTQEDEKQEPSDQ